MKKILVFLILILAIFFTGCASTEKNIQQPIGKGYVNLCKSDPIDTDFWQKNGDVLWNKPWDTVAGNDCKHVATFDACSDLSVIIWEYKKVGKSEWYHVTLLGKNGSSSEGWIFADEVIKTSN